MTIHLYGERVGRLPFPFVDHGVVTPDELNRIYNQCFAGLSLSMTNVSLVPQEMMASGCLPVVNDAEHNRSALQVAGHIAYPAAEPHALAAALMDVCSLPDFLSEANAASKSVQSQSWDDAGALVEQA